MTNYDEDTQDQPVKKRPTRGRIALEATWTGVMAGVLVWLVAGQMDGRTTWGTIGALVYAVFTGWFGWGTVKLIRDRRAPEPVVTGYVDNDGDGWTVQPDGRLTYNGGQGGLWDLDLVEREYGPLQPTYGPRP